MELQRKQVKVPPLPFTRYVQYSTAEVKLAKLDLFQLCAVHAHQQCPDSFLKLLYGQLSTLGDMGISNGKNSNWPQGLLCIVPFTKYVYK